MNIAYVDHSYHSKTGSNQFLVDLLRSYGFKVTLFWDESWRGCEPVSFDSVKEYDIVIMFQSQCSTRASRYSKIHKNIVYIPMLDQFPLYSVKSYDLRYELIKFRGCKIVSFSTGLHCAMMAHGIKSFPVKYYQSHVELKCARNKGMRAFFWIRREDLVSWPMVRGLIGNTFFENVHLHISPDPSSPPITLPSDKEKEKYNITISTWFDNKQDFLRVLDQANVFFAPRLVEGIGQSFLEAMARGQCVVAPDSGTMNEYIIHGVNGMLYNIENIVPLDFSNVESLGRNAQESVRAGVLRWEKVNESLVKFISTPHEEFYDDKWFTSAVCWMKSLDSSVIFFLLNILKFIYNKFTNKCRSSQL